MKEEEDTEWWVSCKSFTCWIKTAGQHGSKIIDAAPIARKWIGQNFPRFCIYYNIDRKERLSEQKEEGKTK